MEQTPLDWTLSRIEAHATTVQLDRMTACSDVARMNNRRTLNALCAEARAQGATTHQIDRAVWNGDVWAKTFHHQTTTQHNPPSLT